MSRAGMANLIERLRTLVNDRWQLRQDTATGDGAGTVYWLTYKPTQGGTVAVGGTVVGTANWSLDSTYGKLTLASAPASGAALTIEYRAATYTDDELEDHLERNCVLLYAVPLQWQPEASAGRTLYQQARVAFRDLEEAESGTVYWRVTDSTGAEVGTAEYTPDYLTGRVRFNADTGGSALYLTARSYDLYAAAADVWLARQAALADSYDFQAGDQRFSRSQLIAQAERMERQMRSRAGANRHQGALRVAELVRTDLNRGWPQC